MSMKQQTSFVPKSKPQSVTISGTLPSLHNNLLLVSTGIPSVDQVVGCMPVGTLLLVEEDFHRCFSNILLRCFIAEGVTAGHSGFIASAEDIKPLVQNLPCPAELNYVEDVEQTNKQLQIAWRYQSRPKQEKTSQIFNSVTGNVELGHHFDLNKKLPAEFQAKMDEIIVRQINLDGMDQQQQSSTISSVYCGLLQDIESCIRENSLIADGTSLPTTVLRIAIQGAGSPMWSSDFNPHENVELLRFLFCLRNLLRRSCAVCMITVPSVLYQGSSFKQRLRNFSDTVIRLEPFAENDRTTNPLFKDYHGHFHIERILRLNSLLGHVPLITDLAFKLSKRKFIVQKLHIPPELGEDHSQTSFCGSTKKTGKGSRSLDF